MRNLKLLSLLLVSIPALAETAPESAFLAGQVGKDPVPGGRTVVHVAPGERVKLDAHFFTLQDGKAVEIQADPEGGTYEWHLKCALEPKKAAVCPQDEFEVNEHGRIFEMPSDPAKGLHVLVGHLNADGVQDAHAEILLQTGQGAADGSNEVAEERRGHRFTDAPRGSYTPNENSAGGHREGGGWQRRGGGTASRGSGGGFGGTSGGASGSSGSSSPGDSSSGSSAGGSPRGKRGSSGGADSAFNNYYSDRGGSDYFGGGGGGGGGGPNTTARGYNRESETSVLTCASVPGAHGMQVVCEHETKELRVHAPEPKPAKKLAVKDEKKKTKKVPAKAAKKKPAA